MNKLILHSGMALLMAHLSLADGQLEEAVGQETKKPEARIVTEIFRGNDSVPSGSNVTLFHDSLVYDFMYAHSGDATPVQVVVFDPQRQRIILLNATNNSQTELTLRAVDELIDLVEARNKDNKELAFLINVQFQKPVFQDGLLTLSSDKLVYQASGQKPKDDEHFHVIMQFMDQFAKLNATNPSALPPFARLLLNKQIRQHNFVPNQVKVNLELDGQKISMTTKHEVSWELSKKDQQLIQYAKQLVSESRRVNFAQFRDLDSKIK